MRRLCIFDLDGTLLDTVADLAQATNYALSMLGYPVHPIENYKIYCGRGIYNLFRAALPEDGRTEENVLRMKGFFLEHYSAHMTDLTRPYPGIVEMMEDLCSKGAYIALASNKYQEGAEKLMRHFFPEVPFVRILGQREGQPMKPDPRIIEECLERCPGLGREDVVYVGDSDVDMQTGAAASVRTIGVLWGFRSRKELERYSPYRIVSTPKELEDAILQN